MCSNISQQILIEFPLDLSEIKVLLRDGTAFLTGTVGSEAAKSRAAELAQSIYGVERVVNRLQVAAALVPADNLDLYDSSTFPSNEASAQRESNINDRANEETNITRHPIIEALGDAVVGHTLKFRIDLALEPDAGTITDPFRVEGLPIGWTKLVVDVEFYSAQLRFGNRPNTGSIINHRNAKSDPLLLETIVDENALEHGGLNITVFFKYGDRHSGIARRHIPLTQGDSIAKAKPSERVDIVPSAESPLLTIKMVSENGNVNGQYLWSMICPRGLVSGALHEWISLGASSQQFAHSLCQNAQTIRPGRHATTLAGIGEQIWRKTPIVFQRIYWAMYDRFGSDFPIQLVTDEPYVPWEIMRPVDETNDRGGDHLFMTHPIARTGISAENSLRSRLPLGHIASFVPQYTGEHRLPFAESEGAWICETLGAKAHRAVCEVFLDLLSSGINDYVVSVVHFAGHAEFGQDHAQSGLLMEDEDYIRVAEVDRTEITLGTKYGSLIVLNACGTGATANTLGDIDGWAAVFSRRRFGGLVAPLWPVADEAATMFVRGFLERLLTKKATLGEAIRDARYAIRNESVTPYAYICYGDVMARVI